MWFCSAICCAELIYTNDSTVVCSAAQVALFDGRNW
jgi:hypothetical protein